MSYKPTIGLEIHAELQTNTKMFCRCRNDADERRPNFNICPVCSAQPGALPVINREAVRQVLRVGLALGGHWADFTEFDRKNYFYPDIPKGYQISQYQYPLVSGGQLAGVKLTRIHLEEDTAKSTHSSQADESLVDFNRSGLPLMELVSEPVIHNGRTAANFAKEFRLLLIYLGASEANMEKGQLRIEANISVSQDEQLGDKVEVKNLNSFRSVERAIDFEIERQTKELEAGGVIRQETRGWDESKQQTFSQRQKESSHDYRYFPEPDLPKLFLSELVDFHSLKDTLPELPWQKRVRYEKDFGLKNEDVEVFVADLDLAVWFDSVVAELFSQPELVLSAANYVTSDIQGARKLDPTLKLPRPTDFADLIKMIKAGEISSRGAKDILAIMLKSGGQPKTIAEAAGLLQVSDVGAIATIIDQVIVNHSAIFEEYRNGKEKSLQFLIGQAMKESQGSANPAKLKEMFVARAQKG